MVTPVPKRVGILIGSATYAGQLPDLRGPRNDVQLLASILRDPTIGHFDHIHEMIDKPSHELRLHLERTVRSLGPEDTLLVHFSGHGRLDSLGQLCLATRDTSDDAILATTIQCTFLRDVFRECRAERKMVWLDCCYSGAAGDAFRSSVNDQIQLMRGAGTFILAASTATETVSERESEEDGLVLGDFSRVIINGLRTGAADVNHRGYITLMDLFHYLEQNLSRQKPLSWGLQVSGHVVVAKTATPPTFGNLKPEASVADLRAMLQRTKEKRRVLNQAARSSPLRKSIQRLRAKLIAGYMLRFLLCGIAALFLPAIALAIVSLRSVEWPVQILLVAVSLIPSRWLIPIVLEVSESIVSSVQLTLQKSEQASKGTFERAELDWTTALVACIERILNQKPGEGMNDLIIEARGQFAHIRQETAAAITNLSKLQWKVDAERRQVNDWENRAALCIKHDRDDLGQQAIARAVEHRKTLTKLENNYTRMAAEVDHMKNWLFTQNELIRELAEINDSVSMPLSGFRRLPSNTTVSADVVRFLNVAAKMFIFSKDLSGSTGAERINSEVAQEYEQLKDRILKNGPGDQTTESFE